VARRWILTALGKDRPGIVADVTKLLFELGCNLEDSAMTRLEGEFAMMVIFSAPPRATDVRLAQRVQQLAQRTRLLCHVKPLTKAETTTAKGGSLQRLSVYGADHPGIVYKVAALLARLRVNITDLSTHRAKALYLMILEVECPPRLRARALQAKLRQLAKHIGVEITLQSAETDIL